jgi:hypothetical protein
MKLPEKNWDTVNPMNGYIGFQKRCLKINERVRV